MKSNGTTALTIYTNEVIAKHQSIIESYLIQVDMDFFRKLLAVIGTNTRTTMQLDLISNLPIEVAQHLLRMLDASSLLNASMVSKKWLSVCKGDSCLRKLIRVHIQTQKRQLVQNIDISRISSKRRHNAVLRKTKVIPGNYYTRGNAMFQCNFNAHSNDPNTYYKPSIKSVKSGMTRSLAKLR